MGTRVVVMVGALALVVVAGAVVGWRLLDRSSTFEQAVGTLPRATLRATYTDWAAVRSAARGTALGAASSRGQVDSFLTRAYDLDLTGTSAVSDSTYALMSRFGFSPLDAQWEILGQSREGQASLFKPPPDERIDALEF